MATATKTKAAAPAEPAVPITFEEINRRKVQERLTAYREIVQRHADGEAITVPDMERAGELLEQLGLPQYTFERDVQAIQRAAVSKAKWQAAVEAQPANAKRAAELAVEIEATRKKWEMLREEHRKASSGATKAGAYDNSLRQLAAEHPHVLGDLDTAVRLRIEELDRRKQIGGAR